MEGQEQFQCRRTLYEDEIPEHIVALLDGIKEILCRVLPRYFPPTRWQELADAITNSEDTIGLVDPSLDPFIGTIQIRAGELCPYYHITAPRVARPPPWSKKVHSLNVEVKLDADLPAAVEISLTRGADWLRANVEPFLFHAELRQQLQHHYGRQFSELSVSARCRVISIDVARYRWRILPPLMMV